MPRVEIPIGHGAFEFVDKPDLSPSHEGVRTLPEGHLALAQIIEPKPEPDMGMSAIEIAQYPGGYFL